MSKALSHFMDHANGVSFRVRAQIGSVVSARSGINLAKHLLHHATEKVNMCYIGRPWHIADSLHFDFVGFRTILCDSVTMENNCSYMSLLFVFIQDNVYLSTPFKGLSQLLPVIINDTEWVF